MSAIEASLNCVADRFYVVTIGALFILEPDPRCRFISKFIEITLNGAPVALNTVEEKRPVSFQKYIPEIATLEYHTGWLSPPIPFGRTGIG